MILLVFLFIFYVPKGIWKLFITLLILANILSIKTTIAVTFYGIVVTIVVDERMKIN